MTDERWFCREPNAEYPCMKSTGGRPGHHPNCGPARTQTGTFEIVLEGDHAPDHLGPGDFYDIDEWRVFLDSYGFDINDVFRVDMNPDDTITVHRYRRGADGRAFAAIDGDVATMDPVTVTPHRKVPVWS